MGRFAALMVAAFCLAHNGLYLSVGSLAPFSDAAGMIGLGAARWLLFLLGIPLLVGFVFVLSAAITMVGFRPADSARKWVVFGEIGLLPLPAVMVIGTLVAPGQQHGATALPMVIWGVGYAVCFAIAAWRARSLVMARSGDVERVVLPQRWSVTVTLFTWVLLVIAVEFLAFRPPTF
jgi:hypothetical protein